MKKLITLVSLLSFALVLPSLANAQMMGYPYYPYNNGCGSMMGYGYGFGIFGWIVMLAFLGITVAGVVILARWLSKDTTKRSRKR